MAREVFMLREGMGTTGGEQMEASFGTTRTLRSRGCEVLEDVIAHGSDVIEHVLRSGAGLGDLFVR